MRISKLAVAAASLLAVGTSAAMADGHSTQGPRIYAYHAENNCPTGLQPITINGVICCGTPNQNVSYQSMMSHPVKKKRVHKVASRADCPVGTKGCTFD